MTTLTSNLSTTSTTHDNSNTGTGISGGGSVGGGGGADPTLTASSSYLHVTHKKQSGTIILNETAFTYYPTKASANTNKTTSDDGAATATAASPVKFTHPWTIISKHQVSPVSHARHLLRILLHKSSSSQSQSQSQPAAKKGVSLTYEFKTRSELERIRKDISTRLVTSRRMHALNNTTNSSISSSSNGRNGNNHSDHSRKRKLEDATSSSLGQGQGQGQGMSISLERQSFTSLTPTESSVTCSSILASDANLRTQHTLLTTNNNTNTTNTDGTTMNGNGNINGNGNGSTNIIHTPAAEKQQQVHMSEEDFWSTHTRTVSNQSAKIHGFVSKGLSSEIKSSLTIQITGNVSKPIQLGVEEMRQIFIMYPAVHAAYEEKVPLELSEEQFWRKYLESEYFHRDRGRMGVSAKSVAVGGFGLAEKEEMEEKKKDADKKDMTEAEKKSAKEEENKAAKEREESARMGAASSNDIFSRKDVELKQRKEAYAAAMAANGTNLEDSQWQKVAASSSSSSSSFSQHIAVGQFDLTSTAQTERGSKLLLLNSSADLHPSDNRGKKVIEKYNRHWTMVLNPDQATAGSDLSALARQSVRYAIENDEDAKVLGGVGREFQRLVGYADASDDCVNHVRMMGGGGGGGGEGDIDEDTLFEELTLKNVDAYAGNGGRNTHMGAGTRNGNGALSAEVQKRNAAFARFALDQVQTMIRPLVDYKLNGDLSPSLSNLDHSFPDAKLGHDLLMALTKHMVLDAMTDKDTKKMTRALPTEFRNKLTSYTRRSSELLRHFFALRHVIDTEKKLAATVGGGKRGTTSKSSEKLKKIVAGMEGVYREMEGMRKELPQSELGEQMRKMCLPIMEQLDCAFKLNRDSSGSGSGFVTVED